MMGLIVLSLGGLWWLRRVNEWTELWYSFFFFFNDTATTEIYTLSLHDALPIWGLQRGGAPKQRPAFAVHEVGAAEGRSPEAAPSFCCARGGGCRGRSEEHTSELQSHSDLVCRLLLEKKKKTKKKKSKKKKKKNKQQWTHALI